MRGSIGECVDPIRLLLFLAETEEFSGDPGEGKRKMRDEPTKWEAMMYQTDYHPTYTMFKRTGT